MSRLDNAPDVVCFGFHNHELPIKPEKMHLDVKNNVVDYLKMKTKPVTIESKFINEAILPIKAGD
jgi:hypothetical protein